MAIRTTKGGAASSAAADPPWTHYRGSEYRQIPLEITQSQPESTALSGPLMYTGHLHIHGRQEAEVA